MGDIGGEALDRAHALPQRISHLAQRAGEVADLIAAPSEIRYLDSGATAARTFRCSGKAADRTHDRAGEVKREQHGDEERHTEDPQQLQPHRAHFFLDLPLPVDSMTAPSTCL